LELHDETELPSSSTSSPDTSDALDALLKQQIASKGGGETDEQRADREKKEAAERAAAEKTAADEEKRKAEEAAKGAETPEAKAAREKKEAEEKAKGTETPEAKAAREKKEAEEKAKVAAEKPGAQKLAELEGVALPPHAKQKSAESFAQVKLLAKQAVEEVSAKLEERNQKLQEAEAKIEELSKKSEKTALTPELEQELNDLRAFRQKMDVEADPSFKTWDAKISENVDLIYAKMKSAGVGEETLKAIKELGGPDQVDWDALSDKVPAALKRYIEGKIFENDDLAEKKKQAIAAAQKNAGEFLKTREAEYAKKSEGFGAEVKGAFEKDLLPKFDWMKPRTATDKSTDEEKKAIEAHNQWLKSIQGDIDAAVQDNSPGMKAVLVASYVQLQHSRMSHDADKAAFKTKEAAWATEKADMEKKLNEANGLLERIKKSSTGRLNSNAPAPGTPASKPKVDVNMSTGDALDAHRAALEASRA